VPTGRPRPFDRLLLGLAACALAGLAVPAASAGFHRDDTPLPADVSGAAGAKAAHDSASTGGAALHMLLALAIVLALIFGLYKLLKRTAGRPAAEPGVPDDGFIDVVSSAPLAPSRSLHLVQVGDELVLVGASEQSVTPIRVYGPDEARGLGIDVRTIRAQAGAGLAEGPERGRGTAAAFVDALRRMTAR